MNKSNTSLDTDGGGDGSTSWEDFYGSSSDLVPTLLNIYESLLARSLLSEDETSENFEIPNEVQIEKTGTDGEIHMSPRNSSENLKWERTINGDTIVEPHAPNLLFNNSTEITNLSSKHVSSRYPPPAPPSTPVSLPSSMRMANGKASQPKMEPKNGLTLLISPTTPNQQYKLGLLSRSFSKWSSRITDKSLAPDGIKNNKGKRTICHPSVVTMTPPNNQPHHQRPLSVNSSTSTSSCSSESSASLNHGIVQGRTAPRASPEDEDDILPQGLNQSDEDDRLPGKYLIETEKDSLLLKQIGDLAPTGFSDEIVDGRPVRVSHPISTGGIQRKQPKFTDPNLSYMDRVVMEIVETERVYVTDLQEIISGYLDHWQKSALNESNLLNMNEMPELFSNIEEIHKFNSEFVAELEMCGLDPVQVARCFVTKNEGFSIYTEYCTHYPRTMFILTEMMRQEHSVKYFRERQGALGHSLPLGSYLLKPVQRILKYHLLLQNILKHYDEGAEGYEVIVEALSAMTNIAHHINDMKRRHEHAVRVQEIQSLLYGWQGEDLTTYGELGAEGTFRVYGAKALRHVFLFDKILLITKKKEDGILSYKSHIMCSNLMLIESVPGEPLSFHVIPFDNPRLQCTLQAKNIDQKREWTLQLKRVILENYHAVIPSHARQLVMELGQCRPEDETFLTEKVQTKRQHSAPEYLERRKQEKDRRKAESTIKAKLKRVSKNDPISPKEGSFGLGRRYNRRTSVDSPMRSPTTTASIDSESNVMNGKLSCPNTTEKRLVKRLSAWRRKSEPGFYLNGINKTKASILSAVHPDNSAENIDEENVEEELDEENSCNSLPGLNDESVGQHHHEQRRESIEEIVGHLVMQNREFQRILSKQRLVHLRRALSQHQQQLHEPDDSGSEVDTEDSLLSTPTKKHSDLMKPPSQTSSSSNGIGSSSDVNEDSVESISSASKDDDLNLLPSTGTKNVQRTVSDPGNKVTLTPRRFINGPLSQYDPISLLWSSFRRADPTKRFNGLNKKQAKREGFGEGKPNIRHTHSFTCSTKDGGIQQSSPTEPNTSKPSLPHGDSGVFPNSFTSDSSASSSEVNIPTLPAVWLKQQGEHLATPNTKSGSLPRSFQVGQHQPSLPPKSEQVGNPGGVKSRIRDSTKYPIPERPFTIASDKPSPSDMNLDDMEHYMSKFNDQMSRCSAMNTAEDLDELTTELTPITSMENLTLHPDHKIYHRSKSSSIKHILLSVTSRLSGLKTTNRLTTGTGSQTSSSSGKNSTDFGSSPNVSLIGNDGSPLQSCDKQKDKTKNVSSTHHRHQKKSFRQKLKDHTVKEDSDSEHGESISSSGFGSVGSCRSSFHNGNSKTVGARLAKCSEHSDYALAKVLVGTSQIGGRGEATISLTTSAAPPISSNGKEEACPAVFFRSNRSNCRSVRHRDLYFSYIDQDGGGSEDNDDDCCLSDSDASADSFYERSFEAIENLLENELLDSVVYSSSDQDGTMDSSVSTATTPSSKSCWYPPAAESMGENNLNQNERRNSLQLPVEDSTRFLTESVRKSRIVCSQAILEKLRHLEQCAQFQRDGLPSPSFEGMKSIQQRRKELELWKNGVGSRGEDESETSSQHSTSTINTVIELSPLKSTSFPSSRRCSDTESSGGNSPLTERAVGGRSQSQGQLLSVTSVNQVQHTSRTTSSDPMPKGWVKLVVGKLEGDGDASPN